MILADRFYKSEHPFLVTTNAGNVVSKHYTAKAAVAACKATRLRRKILGLHQGSWYVLGVYSKHNFIWSSV